MWIRVGVALAAVLSFGVAVGAGAQMGQPAADQAAKRPEAGELRVYFADVEGGQATLFVTPSGESLLIDSGNPGGRDADRVVKLCKQAGLTKIDTVVITHYHTDHVGGIPELVAQMPVGRFVDHGINREDDAGATVKGWNAYQNVLTKGHAQHLVVKPGDVLPIKGMRVEIVSADGEVIAKAASGPGAREAGAGEPNAACAASPEKPAENSENDRSVGMVITFGQLRILDLGDLTWARERGLLCPANKVGQVDVYVVSHHGLVRSGSPALVRAVAPRVAIMDNGGHKGGAPTTFESIEGSTRLKDLWQLHTAEASDAKHNVAESRIANLAGEPDAGNWLELTGRLDGSFSVTNGRTGEQVDYTADR